jgi:hypothetical protein
LEAYAHPGPLTYIPGGCDLCFWSRFTFLLVCRSQHVAVRRMVAWPVDNSDDTVSTAEDGDITEAGSRMEGL